MLRFRQKPGVAGEDPFVHQQNLGREAGGDGECQARHHAGRVGADGNVEIVAEFGEFGDIGHPLFDFARGKSEDQSAQADIVVAADIAIDAEADVEHR